ncbi:MAG: hypothetical protein ALECFALPRED_008091 [Alectoria fallacina]|uniref:Gfo/Idh/MocA-like oxidoreductase N-terminal domain-containing protein n=1 Tax=Alectoria fallacina TaxID=1903189 RepID=A0A8H3J2B0_9LECA|nr:MAG: hypothetical protein ALECFALPRED_008091 [Alectoria fallacina]
MAPLNIAIVGLGQRSRKSAVQVINDNGGLWRLVAACDTKDAAREAFALLHPNVPIFQDVLHLVQWHQQVTATPINCAYVAVLHHLYSEVVVPLLEASIHVLKEKPAASTPEDLKSFQSLGASNSARLKVASQRRYGSHLGQMKEWIPFVGTINTVKARRKISVANLGDDWRAKSSLAGGGAMGDIGWHILDQVLCLVGNGSVPSVAYSKMFHIRTYQGHDCEDSASVILEFPNASTDGKAHSISAHLIVSRIGHEEVEDFVNTGEDGVLSSNGDEISLQLDFASGKRSFNVSTSYELVPESDFERMLKAFHTEITLSSPSKTYYQHRSQDMLVTQTPQNIYRGAAPTCQKVSEPIEGALTDIKQKDSQPERKRFQMQWPIVDADIEQAVITQLHEDIHIWQRRGFRSVRDRIQGNAQHANGIFSTARFGNKRSARALFCCWFTARR